MERKEREGGRGGASRRWEIAYRTWQTRAEWHGEPPGERKKRQELGQYGRWRKNIMA